ncbi:AAA family ATPase [Vibrio splendidus]|uniref:AAA family ATPase n=1 Tax=Vibrio splendidus TaxID=29497 RepID=UPI002735F5EB|nr:AAA family ATPase [Vibrio splendidus]MDP2591536.1 AAA family ATPase [Vibrio splendidus]
MIINKVQIEKFRAFNRAEFTLGEHVTLIAGQNGTQKSTLLGMISQPFTITDKSNPLHGEKPLSGDNFRSRFKDKFRLSPVFDVPKEHEWTLHLSNGDAPLTLQSMIRDKKNPIIRFWRKGNRSAGSGYIQLPVIYLSLNRLIPLGEEDDDKTGTSDNVSLTDSEKGWFFQHYRKIIINENETLASVDYLESPNKKTLGITTDKYDWNSNSAGQDNIGKILLSILSFKRLKEKYGDDYKGGLLAIDEIDATLYPASQVELLRTLSKFCSRLNIQVIATTHSLQLLEEISTLRSDKNRKNQFSTVYLKRSNGLIDVTENIPYERVLHNLNLSMGVTNKPKTIDIFTEDEEAIHYAKALLGNRFKHLKFMETTMGCPNLIDMGKRRVPCFTSPNSIVILDGDARKELNKPRMNLPNYICLPGEYSPEQMLAKYLHNLDDNDKFWTLINPDYNKLICFRNYKVEEMFAKNNKESRVKAKLWYKEQNGTLKVWGRQARKVFNHMIETMEDEKNNFLEVFSKLYDELK